ncbi:MAG: acyl-CoA dehydrogenase family protein, partial [Bdellovibrionia bacterium]
LLISATHTHSNIAPGDLPGRGGFRQPQPGDPPPPIVGSMLEAVREAKAKLQAAQMATIVALDAIQVLGGYGYTREFPVERFMRDAKLIEIGAGTNEIQRVIIARQMLGEVADM